MKIRPLRPEDDRSRFESGTEALDRFFRRYAGQNQFRHHLGVTYVAEEGASIVGFVTVAACHVEVEAITVRQKNGLPRYPLPALRLARLAVDQSKRSSGIRRQLLGFVLQLALEMATQVGCAVVLVDSKPEAGDFYARFGFVPAEPLEGHSNARPQETMMYLMMADIQAAALPEH